MYSRRRERIEEVLETYRYKVIHIDADWPLNVKLAVGCIKDHIFDQDLSVKWLKQKCRINDNNFSGKFKFYVGKSPQEFYISHRLNVAKGLLKLSDLKEVPIMQVALHLGFNSHSAFTMVFKKYENCTPLEYREKNE